MRHNKMHKIFKGTLKSEYMFGSKISIDPKLQDSKRIFHFYLSMSLQQSFKVLAEDTIFFSNYESI